MQEFWQLTLLGRFGVNVIPTVIDFVADAARVAQLSEDAVFHCQISADEACTNVLEHAYDKDQIGDFQLSCHITAGRCEIRIEDHGKPFDPLQVPEPKIGASIDEIEPGGLGIHLMKSMMDEVRFEFVEGTNIVTMVKQDTIAGETVVLSGIKTRYIGEDIAIVEPEGQVDSLAAPALENALTELVTQGRRTLIIDLGRVTYISSRGLKTLITCWRMLQARDGQVLLCAPLARVLRIIETTGLLTVMPVFSSLDDALKAIPA